MEGAAGTALEVTYPPTGEVIARLREATPVLVDKAVRHARVAQKKWAAWSGTERGRVLRRAVNIMRERNRELSVLET